MLCQSSILGSCATGSASAALDDVQLLGTGRASGTRGARELLGTGSAGGTLARVGGSLRLTPTTQSTALTRSHRRRRPRAAFTLIELLVIVTIFTLLLGSVAVALATLHKAHRSLQGEVARATQLSRLARQLREDAHYAAAAEKVDEATLVFNSPSQRIEYSVEVNRVIRTMSRDETVVHRDVFPLANKTSIAWSVTEAERPLVSTTIVYEPADETLGTRTDFVEAVVGLHERQTR